MAGEVHMELRFPAGTAKVGDHIGVEWRGTGDGTGAFGAAQAFVAWDTTILKPIRISKVAAVQGLMLAWPRAGFYAQVNTTAPPTISPFMAVYLGTLQRPPVGNPATPEGSLIGTFVFQCLQPGTADLRIEPTYTFKGVKQPQKSQTFSIKVAGLPNEGELRGCQVVVT